MDNTFQKGLYSGHIFVFMNLNERLEVSLPVCICRGISSHNYVSFIHFGEASTHQKSLEFGTFIVSDAFSKEFRWWSCTFLTRSEIANWRRIEFGVIYGENVRFVGKFTILLKAVAQSFNLTMGELPVWEHRMQQKQNRHKLFDLPRWLYIDWKHIETLPVLIKNIIDKHSQWMETIKVKGVINFIYL